MLDLEEWKNAAELARAENESLQMKMRKMRAQLESAVRLISNFFIFVTGYKNVLHSLIAKYQAK